MTNHMDIREYTLNMERVDTHTHFSGILTDLRDDIHEYAHLTDSCTLTDSKARAAGCRELYGIDPGVYLQPDSPDEIFDRAAQLRSMGAVKALEYVLDKCHIATQLAFTDHDPAGSPLYDFSPRVRIISYIDELIFGDTYRFCPDGRDEDFCYYTKLCERLGKLDNLDDYLSGLDRVMDSWKRRGVVAMKTAMAYFTGLYISDPSYGEAKNAFQNKKAMSDDDIRAVRDYAFRHCLLACKRNGFPAVIHTGFLIYGHADLSQSDPMLLHNLLIDKRYKDITFVLLHGGNPYVGETAYLAGMFTNVYIDFTWISWISRTRFRSALAEWIELVPHERFCWGSDNNSLECIAGINAIVREEISGVLEDMLQRRMIDMKLAVSFLKNTYMDTPKRIFSL